MYLAWDPTLIWIFSYDNSIQAIVVRLCDFSLKTTHPWFQRAFYPSLIFYKLKKESTTSSSNKGAKTLYRNYLHCIENFCAILSKWIISTKILKFTRKYCQKYWNETDDEILPVFPQFLWTLKFIFSVSHGKLYLVLSQTTVLENVKRTVTYFIVHIARILGSKPCK